MLTKWGAGERRLNPVDEADRPESRAAHFRSVATRLREIAAGQRYDIRRRDPLLALADGFERFADRLEREAIGG